jgi:hypothetical protein
MNFNILISESQKRRLIIESVGDNLGKDTKKLFDLTKSIINQSSEQLGMNLQFMLTWGASIGGLMGPLSDYIEGKSPSITDMDKSLILIGVISVLYYDNKESIEKILKKIKDGGLSDEFLDTLRKGKEIKKTFLDFLSSLNISAHKMTNIMSYTFIIPLLPMLYSISQSGEISPKDIESIVKRIAGFGMITVSGIALKELIGKIIKRFGG